MAVGGECLLGKGFRVPRSPKCPLHMCLSVQARRNRRERRHFLYGEEPFPLLLLLFSSSSSRCLCFFPIKTAFWNQRRLWVEAVFATFRLLFHGLSCDQRNKSCGANRRQKFFEKRKESPEHFNSHQALLHTRLSSSRHSLSLSFSFSPSAFLSFCFLLSCVS